MQNAQQGENIGLECPSSMECIEHVASSSNIPGVSMAISQSCTGPECYKVLSGSDHLHPAKARKLTVERDPKKYVYHLFWLYSSDIKASFTSSLGLSSVLVVYLFSLIFFVFSVFV